MAFRGYRRVINRHALNRIIKPVYKPRPKLAIYPQEPLHSMPQPYRFVPAHRYDVTYQDYRADVNKLYEQQPELPGVEKPTRTHWFGYPV